MCLVKHDRVHNILELKTSFDSFYVLEKLGIEGTALWFEWERKKWFVMRCKWLIQY